MYFIIIIVFALNDDDSQFVVYFFLCVKKHTISGIGKYIKMYGCFWSMCF